MLHQCQQLMGLQFNHPRYGGMDPVGTFSSSIITVYSGIDTALTVCSASVDPVVEPAATVVAIFGDSEQSGSRAQQCQRSLSVTVSLSQNQFKQCSLGRSNSVQTSSAQQWLSECSDKTNSVLRKLSIQYKYIYIYSIYFYIYIYTVYISIYIYTVCVCVQCALIPLQLTGVEFPQSRASF